MEIIFWFIVLGSIGYLIASKKIKQDQVRQSEVMQRAILISDVDRMTGVAFEHYVARLLINEGYTGVAVTKASGDFGVDVTGVKSGVRYAIQVKRHTGSVSRRAVSDAVTGRIHYGCDRAMVVTNRHLSTQARAFAASVGCEVIDREMLSEWIYRYQNQQAINGAEEKSFPLQGTMNDANILEVSRPPLVVDEKQYTEHYSISREASPARSLSGSQRVPTPVLQKIKELAASAHPNDFSTQKYVINDQVASYVELISVNPKILPEIVFSKVRDRLAREHEFDYATQLYVLREQMDSYNELLSISPPDVPKNVLQGIIGKAQADHPYDFSTQLYVVNEQVAAYSSLNGTE